MTSKTLLMLAAAATITLSGCGGDAAPVMGAPNVPEPPVVTPEPPVVPPEPPVVTPEPPVTPPGLPAWFTLQGMCETPRPGLGPDGLPYPDRQGTHETEMTWVRAFIDETYLWYKEIPTTLKADDYKTPIDYFNVLKTPAVTPSGRAKDRFHFTYPTAVWNEMSRAGVTLGYGLTWVRNTDPTQPRVWMLTMVEPGSPADQAGLRRGDQLVSADGVAVGDSATDAVAKLNAALFPVKEGEVHQLLLSRGGTALPAASLAALKLSVAPVQNTKVIDTPTGKVGYLLFKEHNAISESQLIEAISNFKTAGIADLVIDMRYNGGGLLAIASELAYMVAGPQATDGKVFEQSEFNDRSKPRAPQMFASKAIGYAAPVPVKPGTPLPYLGLKRVTVLTTPGTCSASESVINSLRGVEVEVNLIGAPTCGKPYGFYPAPNCGTTYFTIQFHGVNDKGYGDYADGFQPTCDVADDLAHPLGDSSESLLAAALNYRATGVCPAQPLQRRAAAGAMQLVRPAVQEISIDDRRR
jgi:carboxyl-terminal processing protease